MTTTLQARYCKHTKSNGKQCGAYALTDDTFCLPLTFFVVGIDYAS